jgi:hypothetical protein
MMGKPARRHCTMAAKCMDRQYDLFPRLYRVRFSGPYTPSFLVFLPDAGRGPAPARTRRDCEGCVCFPRYGAGSTPFAGQLGRRPAAGWPASNNFHIRPTLITGGPTEREWESGRACRGIVRAATLCIVSASWNLIRNYACGTPSRHM